jgi:serpin B
VNAFVHDEAQATSDGVFYQLDGTEVTVPMMAQTESFPYTEGEGFQAVDLPYDGGAFSMVILLPQPGQFKVFEDSLEAERASSILMDAHTENVRLTMPKLAYDSSFELTETLSDMGMPEAFAYRVADFSGMDGSRELFIGQVVHKAFVAVDEEGTEAGATSAVVFPVADPQPSTPIEVTVDRPFAFLIHDIRTDAILFVGCVLHPGACRPLHL